MPTCLECGFAGRGETGPCPRCGAVEASPAIQPTEMLSIPDLPRTGLPPGHLLARKYEIRKKLGGGGFGWVYLAHDVGLDKDVAVKVLHVADPSSMDAAEAKKRFLREARALARLDEHPNVVRVMNVDEENGIPYFVMEYVPGGTLHDLLASGPLPPSRAAQITADVAAALAAVHASGIVHRDLKPANVFLKGDRAMLGDFGIAHVAHESSLTVASATPGTPMYMSPESLLGRDVDGRSDLFSLGCLLYEALAGGVLFKGDSVGQVVGRIIDPEEVSLASLEGSIPAPLLAILRRSLAKKVVERYPSARFMERDLRAYAADPNAPALPYLKPPRPGADAPRLSVPTRPMPRGAVEGAPAKPSSDRRSVALASVALVLAAAALGYVVHTLNAPPPAAPAAKPARDPAGRAPAGSPSAPGAAASAGTSAAPPPADPNPAVDIGVDVVGPVKTLAQPSAPGRSPAAGLSTARDVASSWSPTRVEDAMAKGFRPGRGVNVERRFAFLTDDMTPPELISKVEPLYPEEARSAGEEGSVVMEVLVERTGEVAGVKVVKGSPPFDEAASEAVKQWRFRPAMQDGRAVKVLATITVTFKRESTP